MEKIVTLLWKNEQQSNQAFADALLALAPSLQTKGARALKICLCDDDVAAGESLHMVATDARKSAMVSYWTEMAQSRDRVESLLEELSSSMASFLVVESRPLLNTDKTAPLATRTPGFSQVTCVEKRNELSTEEFINIWQTEHMACAIETQSTYGYVRNEIVRVLREDVPGGKAPTWSAVVEESFPIEALDTPAAFYDAVGDDEKFQTNLNRMITTVSKFLSFDAMDVTPMSEYIYENL